MKDFQIVILAAGLGSRMQQDIPKCLTVVNGETILMQEVRFFRAVYGPDVEIIFVLGYRASLVISAIEAIGDKNISYVINREYDAGGIISSAIVGAQAATAANVLRVDGDLIFRSKAARYFLDALELTKTALFVQSPARPMQSCNIAKIADGKIERIVQRTPTTLEDKEWTCIELYTDFQYQRIMQGVNIIEARKHYFRYLMDAGIPLFAYTVDGVLEIDTQAERAEIERSGDAV